MKKNLLLIPILGCAVATSAMAGVGDIWGFNLRSTNNWRVWTPGTPGDIGTILFDNIEYDSYAIDFNSVADTLYAVVNTDLGADIGVVSQTDGSFTANAPISDLLGTVTGLSVDPTDETFYLSSFDSASGGSILWTLDPNSGATNQIGVMTGDIIIDIAIDANGQLYAHNITDDSLYSVNKNDASVNLIGSHGLAANFAQGMDFDFSTNTLYATIYTGGGTGKFVEWNTADGSITEIIDTTEFNVEIEMAVQSPIPAPGALALLGLGGLVLRRRRR